MIFVTVGTHEQAFNRLIEYVDSLVKDGTIAEEVVIQTGFSTYQPQYCSWQKLFPYSQMIEKVKQARIVITHGGPASFIMPLQIGKIPVVVPRQFEFDEHVNSHQVEFARIVKERQGNIIPIYDIKELKNTIVNYDSIIETMPKDMKSNNKDFNKEFSSIVCKLFI